MTLKVTISNQTVIRVLSLVVAFWLTVNFVIAAQAALTLIFLAFFLALALSPVVNKLANLLPKSSRLLATATAYIITLGLIALLASAIVPPLVRQTNQLINNLPEHVESLSEKGNFVGDLAARYDIASKLKGSQDEITSKLTGAGGPLVNFIQKITGSVIAVLTILVLAFFMLVEGPRWLERFWKLQPVTRRKHRQELAVRMYKVVTGFVNGQLLVAGIGGAAAFIAMIVVGVPFALPLAVLQAVLGLIPLIGATIGSLVVILVALTNSLSTAVVILIYFVVYQQVENNVIQPYIQSKTINLSPLTILVSAIIGVSLAGFMGALVAIPIAASLRILINDYIDNHKKTQE